MATSPCKRQLQNGNEDTIEKKKQKVCEANKNGINGSGNGTNNGDKENGFNRRVWPDKGNQVASYPPVPFKQWTLFPWPRWRKESDAQEFFDELKDLKSRDDDIFLVTVQKAGTHWAHEIVNMLVDQTTAYNSRNLALDDIHVDTMTDLNRLESETRRRILHTHLPFQFLPTAHLKKKAKVIIVNRNPKDRHVSQYNFFKKMVGTPENYSWEQYWNEMVLKDEFMTGWFNWTREMVAAAEKNPDFVTMVFFEDLKLTPEKEIAKLAKFLDVPYNDEFVHEIADKCSFTKLKNHKLDGTAEFAKNFESTLFRKGQIGDWKTWFTVAQNEQFDQIYDREMKGVNLTWKYE